MQLPAPRARTLLRAQALYYAGTGIWPLVDIESFERVTGPKTDRWLVRTVGALVSVVGASLALAARGEPDAPAVTALGAGSAGALGAVDVIYVANRTIPPVYLFDAAAQAFLLSAWIVGSRSLGASGGGT
jgi:hypothetical protein